MLYLQVNSRNKKGKKAGKDVPQLGQQAKQSIKPLVVLTEVEQGVQALM
jgi:hypothetical protein